MSKEVKVTISTIGATGSGKSRAIDLMAAALRAEFEIVAQTPKMEASNAESYTFRIRMKEI